MKTLFTTTALIAASTFVGTANAATVLIDFGPTGFATGNAGGVQYNDIHVPGTEAGNVVSWVVNGSAESTDPAELLDTTNVDSGWTLSMELASGGSSKFGSQGGLQAPSPFPTGLSAFEESALESSSYNNRYKQTTWTFDGLDDNATYEIIIYGNGRPLGNANTDFVPLIGSGSGYGTETVNTDGVDTGTYSDSTHTDYLHWTDITSVGGVIEFRMDSDFETWLNFAAITDETFVPEPSSLALLGLGGLAILRRRRG